MELSRDTMSISVDTHRAPIQYGSVDKKSAERFWAKVDKRGPGGCWLWTGAIGSNGYGQFVYKGAVRPAHRVALLIVGREPGESWALHRCDVRACVNPSHLFLGTHRDNMVDMVAKGRHRDTSGESNPSAKLTAADVCNIRRMAAEGTPLRIIRVVYRISKAHASDIVAGRKWKCLV